LGLNRGTGPGCRLSTSGVFLSGRGAGAGEDEFGEGEEGQGGQCEGEASGQGVDGVGELDGDGDDRISDQDGHGVGDGAVLPFAAADLDAGGGRDELGDDGVGPAEPGTGPGRDIAHGPVVDMGEGTRDETGAVCGIVSGKPRGAGHRRAPRPVTCLASGESTPPSTPIGGDLPECLKGAPRPLGCSTPIPNRIRPMFCARLDRAELHAAQPLLPAEFTALNLDGNLSKGPGRDIYPDSFGMPVIPRKVESYIPLP